MNGALYQHEFIGKEIEIKIQEKKFIGIVLDETKKTITILDKNNIKKKLLKSKNMTITKINKKQTNISGEKINIRPHERIKLR